MPIPKACPVCGNECLEPIVRKFLSSPDESAPSAVSGTFAYRCANGHVFMAEEDGPQIARKAAAD